MTIVLMEKDTARLSRPGVPLRRSTPTAMTNIARVPSANEFFRIGSTIVIFLATSPAFFLLKSAAQHLSAPDLSLPGAAWALLQRCA